MTRLLFGRADGFTARHQGATLAAALLLISGAAPLADLVALLLMVRP